MKRIALTMGLLFSLPLLAEIAKVEPRTSPLVPMRALTAHKDKASICKALTEKETQRQTKTSKGKGSPKATKPVPLTIANVCEFPASHITIEDKTTLPTNKTFVSVGTLTYGSDAGGYWAVLVETKTGVHPIDLLPISPATTDKEVKQTLTISSIKVQDIVPSGAEELIIQFSTTQKSDERTITKESIVICGVNKELACLMPIRIADKNKLAGSEFESSWRLSYEFSDNKITILPAEVNGKKQTNKAGLSSLASKGLGTWEIPL
jgi:hypothetical protein